MTQEIEREALPPLPYPWMLGNTYDAVDMRKYGQRCWDAALSMKAPAEPVPRAWFRALRTPEDPGGPYDAYVDMVWGDQPDGSGWKPLCAAQPPVDGREALRAALADMLKLFGGEHGGGYGPCDRCEGVARARAALNQVESDSGKPT